MARTCCSVSRTCCHVCCAVQSHCVAAATCTHYAAPCSLKPVLFCAALRCAAPCTLVAVQVLHEYQRRDSLMQQLLSERDEMRRASRRSTTESSKLERERDDAIRTVNKLKVSRHMLASTPVECRCKALSWRWVADMYCVLCSVVFPSVLWLFKGCLSGQCTGRHTVCVYVCEPHVCDCAHADVRPPQVPANDMPCVCVITPSMQ